MVQLWGQWRGMAVAAGFSFTVATALVLGAGKWSPPFPSITDGKAAPAGSSRPELQQSPVPGTEPEAHPARDPARFYKKPPRERKPRTEMFAASRATTPRRC